MLDFGVAKAVGVHGDTPAGPMNSATVTSPAMTQAGMILGTAAYMSPEQARLAYESRESGPSEVYVQAYPSATGRLRVSIAGGAKPRWGKNNQLIFLSNTTFMVSTVSTHPELHADAPRPIVDEPLLVEGGDSTRAYDVAPDGRILAIEEDDSVRSDHIVVVRNWLSETRAPLANSRKTP